MNETTSIEIPVEKRTAEALVNRRRLQAVGRLVDRLVRPGNDDPLLALLERTSTEAQVAGVTDDKIEAELASYNADRRA